jgi:hypothetical protein
MEQEVFIGCSQEEDEIATALQQNLGSMEMIAPIIWRHSDPASGTATLDHLITATGKFEARDAILIQTLLINWSDNWKRPAPLQRCAHAVSEMPVPFPIVSFLCHAP